MAAIGRPDSTTLNFRSVAEYGGEVHRCYFIIGGEGADARKVSNIVEQLRLQGFAVQDNLQAEEFGAQFAGASAVCVSNHRDDDRDHTQEPPMRCNLDETLKAIFEQVRLTVAPEAPSELQKIAGLVRERETNIAGYTELFAPELGGAQAALDRLNRAAAAPRANPSDENLAQYEKNLQKALTRFLINNQELENLIEIGKRNNFISIKFSSLLDGTLFHLLSKHPRTIHFIPAIIEAGSDPSSQDRWGNTGLIWAIANACNSTAMQIITLLGKGSYLDIQCFRYGNTALHLAVAKGYKDRSKDDEKLDYTLRE